MDRKRLLDVLMAGVGMVVLAPLGLLIATTILLLDGRPVFFRQERVGRGGVPFRIWKFRTMKTTTASRARQITVEGDDRITTLGRWLRRYKADELPQLLNVLRGEMSIVGPRPEMPEYVARYTPEQRKVLDQLPGITDPASLRYRNENQLLAQAEDPERCYIEDIMPDKIRINLEYTARATLWSDIRMILKTSVDVFR